MLPRRLAHTFLTALAKGHEDAAWDAAQALAKRVLDDKRVALAKAVLEAGPFAMRRAVNLAETVLRDDGAQAAEQDEQAK